LGQGVVRIVETRTVIIFEEVGLGSNGRRSGESTRQQQDWCPITPPPA
jgi:hypothetical protein